jgi:hypothetical protein
LRGIEGWRYKVLGYGGIREIGKLGYIGGLGYWVLGGDQGQVESGGNNVINYIINYVIIGSGGLGIRKLGIAPTCR